MKLSIRDLLLVTVIVALGLGWWLERGGRLKQANDLQKQANEWRSRAEELASLTDRAGLEVTWLGNRVGYTPRKGNLFNMQLPAPDPPPKAPTN